MSKSSSSDSRLKSGKVARFKRLAKLTRHTKDIKLLLTWLLSWRNRIGLMSVDGGFERGKQLEMKVQCLILAIYWRKTPIKKKLGMEWTVDTRK
jgi:hypothetical protein